VTDNTETPTKSRPADEELRVWAIEQAVEFTKGRDSEFGLPTRVAAMFVRYVTKDEVQR
jgi:hypothetical protein